MTAIMSIKPSVPKIPVIHLRPISRERAKNDTILFQYQKNHQNIANETDNNMSLKVVPFSLTVNDKPYWTKQQLIYLPQQFYF